MRYALLASLPLFLTGCSSDNEKIKGKIADAFDGYEVRLSAQGVSKFQHFLKATVPEWSVPPGRREEVRRKMLHLPASDFAKSLHLLVLKNKGSWQVNAVAAIVAADVRLFEEEMRVNTGSNGLCIRVWGTKQPDTTCTRITSDLWDWILPSDLKAGEVHVDVYAPLYWKIVAQP